MDTKPTHSTTPKLANGFGACADPARHAISDNYLQAFPKAGHSVALAEQVQGRQSHRDSSLAFYCDAVRQVIPTMYARYGEPLSLQEMAETVSLSPHHFNRIFRKVTGVTPARFLSALRLRAAVHLLLTTELSVTEICFDVGYNSLGTFTSRFTQLVGLPPTRLRELAQSAAPVLAQLCADGDHLRFGSTRHASVSGCIEGFLPDPAWIFVGLFPTSIPQGCPTGCTLLAELGEFAVGPVVDGRYHLFAAGFPKSTDPASFLIPDLQTLRVGSGKGGLTVHRGRANRTAHIAMRRMRITDPPIVTAMPLLMVEKVRKIEEALQT